MVGWMGGWMGGWMVGWMRLVNDESCWIMILNGGELVISNGERWVDSHHENQNRSGGE